MVMDDDLSRWLGPDFADKWPADYIRPAYKPRVPIFHLCGGLDNVSLGNCESEVSFRNCVEGISRCDMQMCKSTRTESGYDDCGTGLISKLCQENSSDCGVGWCTSYSFYSQESADECVWDVFAFTGDYSRCSLIHDPDLRDLCTSRAASQ